MHTHIYRFLIRIYVGRRITCAENSFHRRSGLKLCIHYRLVWKIFNFVWYWLAIKHTKIIIETHNHFDSFQRNNTFPGTIAPLMSQFSKYLSSICETSVPQWQKYFGKFKATLAWVQLNWLLGILCKCNYSYIFIESNPSPPYKILYNSSRNMINVYVRCLEY